jgi:hypothetical protein
VTSRPSKRLIAALALLASTSLLLFGWLAWRSYLGRQPPPTVLIDRLTETGALVAREIGTELDRWQAMAASEGPVGVLPASGTLLAFNSDAVIAVRGQLLAYYPAVSPPEVPTDDRLLRAQAAERAGDLDAAIAGFRAAATSTARTPRAMATAGLGRMLRAKGNTREALSAYDELAQMVEARVSLHSDPAPHGHPAPLVAYRERQAIFLALGDTASAERERARIDSDLRARTYLIDRATFEAFAPALVPGQYSPPLLARSDVVKAEFWERWRSTPSGRALAGTPDHAFAAVWRPSPDGTVAIVAPTDVLMEQAMTMASRLSTSIALEDSGGRHIWGKSPPTDSATVRLNDIGLPASLRLWLREP